MNSIALEIALGDQKFNDQTDETEEPNSSYNWIDFEGNIINNKYCGALQNTSRRFRQSFLEAEYPINVERVKVCQTSKDNPAVSTEFRS